MLVFFISDVCLFLSLIGFFTFSIIFIHMRATVECTETSTL